MPELDIKPELLDARIEAMDAFIADLQEMLETDDSIPAASMEMYERSLSSSKRRLEGLKAFRNILGGLDG